MLTILRKPTLTPSQTCRLTAAAMIAPALLGCSEMKSDWAYRRIQVGQTTQTEAVALLPDTAQKTTVSLALWQARERPLSRDAIVILLDDTGAVTGKARVKARLEHYGFAKKWVTVFDLILRAESDERIIDEGPVARLRDLYDRLEKKQYDRQADQAHALVCAAILRTLEAMPDVTVKPSKQQRFADMLGALPPNGDVTLRIQPGKLYEIRYTAESTTMGKIVFPDSPENP
jgi:hypothetical protein